MIQSAITAESLSIRFISLSLSKPRKRIAQLEAENDELRKGQKRLEWVLRNVTTELKTPCPYGIFGIPIDSNMYEIEDR